MTPPNPTDSRSSTPDTLVPVPVPYRLDTSAVRVVYRPITTMEHAVIRESIEPRRGWWQFELRPWHYAVSIASTVIVTAAFLTLLTTFGGAR